MPVINTIIMVILAASCLILFGMAAVLNDKTLIDFWLPAVICVALAIPCGFLLRGPMQMLTRFKKTVWNVLAGAVLALAVFIGSFYIINYYKSDESSAYQYSAKVVSKYTKQRHHTKRVGRNRVAQGEPYNVYFISVELPNGGTKDMEVPYKDYAKIKRNRNVTLDIEDGFFGVPVIKDITKNTSRKSKV